MSFERASQLNHNWCNSVSLPSLYDSMKEAVEEVMDAISDVRELLETHHGHTRPQDPDLNSSPRPAEPPWQAEWHQQVARLLTLDAGWDWAAFFRMIARNIDPDTIVAPVRSLSSFNSSFPPPTRTTALVTRPRRRPAPPLITYYRTHRNPSARQENSCTIGYKILSVISRGGRSMFILRMCGRRLMR